MAHKDYVSRGRASKKQPPQEKAAVPWIRILITLALVAGFAYLLYSIKDRAEEQTDTAQETQQEAEEDALPILEDEEWDFIKTLPVTTVQVEVPEQQKSDKRYLMQCGSFRQQDQAEEMKATIAFAGLVAQVGPISGKNGLWYRVYLGPYDLKREAEKDRHTLRRSNINTCKIWYWNL